MYLLIDVHELLTHRNEEIHPEQWTANCRPRRAWVMQGMVAVGAGYGYAGLYGIDRELPSACPRTQHRLEECSLC